MSKRRKRRKLKRIIPVVITGIVICALFGIAASSLAYLFTSASASTDPSAPDGYQQQGDSITEEGRKEGAYTFLIGGTDKSGERTDSLLLVYLNSNEKALNIMSIPRDTYVDSGLRTHKVNTLYAVGGGSKMEEVLSKTFGIPIDYYAVIKVDTFREIVDMVGGVPINVSFDMDYDDDVQDLHIHIPQGEQVLDGEDAEGFCRYRSGYAGADLTRIEAQHIFISSFIKTMLSAKNITKIPSIVNTVFKNIKTDMSAATMIKVGTSALSVDMSNIKMYSLPGEWYSSKGYYTTYQTETLQILNQSFNPRTTPIVTNDLVELGRTSTSEVSLEGDTATELEVTAPPSKTK